MENASSQLPGHYRAGIRTLVRYAIVMTFVALLSGVLFQESSKKVARGDVTSGVFTNAAMKLALVHGHAMVITVLVPIAMAGLLLIGRRAGGGEIGPGYLKWLCRGYLPMATLTLALMLWKGYFILLSVRGGATDLDVVQGDFFFGLGIARHLVYGVVHVGMAVSLCAFLVGVWKSLKSIA